jgi:hypothetical protein
VAKEDKLVPRNPNEVVVPVGKANLLTTKEEIDEALKTASHIFRDQNEEKKMEENTLNEELETSLEVTNETPAETPAETTEETLVELSADELAALPNAKYGRDKYGRALNKNGTPRKARNDKGVKRGAYGPRTPKVNTETTVTEVTQEVASSVVDSE